MKNRFSQAIRLLLGRPLVGLSIDGTMLLDKTSLSEFDYTKMPPFDLTFDGPLAVAPPAEIFRKERFRVCVFPEKDGTPCEDCGRTCRWLTHELRDGRRWYH